MHDNQKHFEKTLNGTLCNLAWYLSGKGSGSSPGVHVPLGGTKRRNREYEAPKFLGTAYTPWKF